MTNDSFKWSPMLEDFREIDGRGTVTGPLFVSAIKLCCLDPRMPAAELAKKLQVDRVRFIVNNREVLDEALVHLTQVSLLSDIPGHEFFIPLLLLPGTSVELHIDSTLSLAVAWKIRRLTAEETLNVLEKLT